MVCGSVLLLAPHSSLILGPTTKVRLLCMLSHYVRRIIMQRGWCFSLELDTWAKISAEDSLVAGPELWHTALELMGGQFADLSTALKTTYTGYRSDVMGHDKKSSETAPEQTSSSSDPPPETDKQEDQK